MSQEQSTEDIVRVLRLVEYEGPRSLVEKQLAGSVHGTRFGYGNPMRSGSYVRITVTTLGVFPEVIEEARRVPDPQELAGMQAQLARTQQELAMVKMELDGWQSAAQEGQ